MPKVISNAPFIRRFGMLFFTKKSIAGQSKAKIQEKTTTNPHMVKITETDCSTASENAAEKFMFRLFFCTAHFAAGLLLLS